MDWHLLTASSTLEEAISLSYTQPVLLFKHSYRCSISAVVFSRMQREWKAPPTQIAAYLVDVVKERNLAREIADRLGIRHESPQALILRNGNCTYQSSHMAVTVGDLMKAVESDT